MYCRYLHVIQVLIKLTKNKEKTIAITLPQRKSYNIYTFQNKITSQDYTSKLTMQLK